MTQHGENSAPPPGIESVEVNGRAAYAAFDGLPAELRAALREATEDWNPIQYADALKLYSVPFLLRVLRADEDKARAAHALQRLEACSR